MPWLAAPWAAWAAFAVGNATCCGLIAAAVQVSWRLALALTVAYFVASAALALNVEQRPPRPPTKPLRDLLWVAVCLQLGVLGTWLAVALGPWEDFHFQQATEAAEGAGHGVLGQQLYFSANRTLMRAEQQAVSWVPPGVIEAHSFLEHQGRLFFFGRPVPRRLSILFDAQINSMCEIPLKFS